MTVTDPAALVAEKIHTKLKLSSLKVNDAIWTAFLASNSKAILDALIHSKHPSALVFHLHEGQLRASTKPAPTAAGRCVFFVKPGVRVLTPDAFDSMVASGESAGGLPPAFAAVVAGKPAAPPGTALPLPAVDFAALERAVADRGCVVDRSTMVLLESAAATWAATADAASSAPPMPSAGAQPHGAGAAVVDAWSTRANTLAALTAQMRSPAVALVQEALEQGNTGASARLRAAWQRADAAAEESRMIETALRPVRPLLSNLAAADDLLAAADAATLAFAGLSLAWRHCPSLRAVPSALLALAGGAAADVVEVARRCGGGRDPLRGDLADSAVTARATLRTLGHLKSCYADAGARAATTTDASTPWPAPGTAFKAVDEAMARCQELHAVATAAGQYARLESVDLGGPEGAGFTAAARQLHAEFAASLERLAAEGGDPLGAPAEAAAFTAAAAAWRRGLERLDARLAALVAQALSVAPTLEAAGRLLDSLEGLVERPAVRRAADAARARAARTFAHDIRAVAEAIEREKHAPPLPPGAPPCAGAVAWVRGLQDRLAVPMARLRAFSGVILDGDPAKDTLKAYENVMAVLKAHEDAIMAAWCDACAGVSEGATRRPVLIHAASGEGPGLQVNFDPGLALLLREVRALTALPALPRAVPSPALAFFKREAALLRHAAALGSLAAEINAVRASLLAVEAPLVASALAAAERAAARGQRDVTWASADLDEYASCAAEAGKELARQFRALRDAAAAAEGEAAAWAREMPLDPGGAGPRRANTPLQGLVELHSWLSAASAARKRAVVEGGRRLATALAAAAQALSVDAASPSWAAFMAHVADIAASGLRDAVKGALEALAALLTAQPGGLGAPPAPLLTVSLQLQTGNGGGLQWIPPLGAWTDQKPAAVDLGRLPEAAAGAVQSYTAALASLGSGVEITSFLGIKSSSTDKSNLDSMSVAVKAVGEAFSAGAARADTAATALSKFRALWESQPPFADPNRPLEEIEAEIQRLKATQEEIVALTPPVPPAAWLAVDMEPARQALAAAAGKRAAALAEGVKSRVQRGLGAITAFVSEAGATIAGAGAAAATATAAAAAPSRRASTATATGHRPSLSVRASISGAAAHLSAAPRSSRPSLAAGAGAGSRRPSGASSTVAPDTQQKHNREQLYAALRCLREVGQRAAGADAEMAPLLAASAALQRCGSPLPEDLASQLAEAPQAWRSLVRRASTAKETLAPAVAAENADAQRAAAALARDVDEFRAYFQKAAPYGVPDGGAAGAGGLTPTAVDRAFAALDALVIGGRREDGESSAGCKHSLHELTARSGALKERRALLAAAGAPSNTSATANDPSSTASTTLQRCAEEVEALRALWEEASATLDLLSSWDATPWPSVDADALGEEFKKKARDVKALPRTVRDCEAFKALEGRVKGVATVLPLVRELALPAMKERHWAALGKTLGASLPADPASLTLGALLALRLDRCADACAEIVDTAKREAGVERTLAKIETAWGVLSLSFAPLPGRSDSMVALSVDPALTEALESDGVALQNLGASKAVAGNPTFRAAVTAWQRRLAQVDAVLSVWTDAQRKWTSLEAIFRGSADIRARLPTQAAAFDAVDADFRDLMAAAPSITAVLDACAVPGRQERLEGVLRALEGAERALLDYLETKRQAFPRFYFVSTADLLDILAKGTDAHAVERHLPKLFDNVARLEWKKDGDGRNTATAVGMYSGEGEYVAFVDECVCTGAPEMWLAGVVEAMKGGLRAEYAAAMPAYEERPRAKWVFDWSAQTTAVVSRTYFTAEVNDALAAAEGGDDEALRRVLDRQKAQLADLIALINGPLSKNDRKKLITLCTIDVHARDVVARLAEARAESPDAFAWQSQLRYSRDPATGDPIVQICDATIPYGWEYIGNCGCLCITPLTDRCYITLTQAQRLGLGGAPAGPAGTGKTETTKDLARALGLQCYVFNCSDQMDYKAMGAIYKGLAQTGAWGCFDEFNRIPVPVLSVCSTQYKAVLDALRARATRFVFEGAEIDLKPSVMAHITMNPGYAGRAELPESLKALFRPVSMAAPDLALICEIMLMAEGFQQARALSRKFIALYRLCEDLLSKAKHYDWKLRAIKTTLYVAGGMKRAAPELSEERVLLRALRDFNLGKLTADDAAVFAGLLEDLFPGASAQVPRALERNFEGCCREAALQLGYQPDPQFLLKVSQLREIFEVRWSVFLLGPPGCGKTAVWRTLQRALQLAGHRAVAKVINPKAVTRDELYGSLHPTTREWREGLLSSTFRTMAGAAAPPPPAALHQWIVLDGDIDPEWIESMNTVMDDNKVLTLASNERIPLAPSMRLLLEISHMNHASPATVSRGGVIYLNAEDVGWRAATTTWLERCCGSGGDARAALAPLFDRYLDSALEWVRKKGGLAVPLPAVAQAETVCKLLEGLLGLTPPSGDAASPASPPSIDLKHAESKFIFACVWGVGGALSAETRGGAGSDARAAFSTWWTSEHKTVPFPATGSVFDYYVDPVTGAWTPWAALVPKFDFAAAVAAAAAGGPPGAPLDPAALFVPTVETTRLQYMMHLLVKNGHSAMLVGGAGTGKTATIRSLLRSLDPEAWATAVLPLHALHDGPSMQAALEAPLERKTGARYGPPGSKRLLCFVDDANMPGKDKYDTQTALELLRQAIDAGGWYDKAKATPREVSGVQFLAALNPSCGSFVLSGRLQRHFTTFYVPPPSPEALSTAFSTMVAGHFAGPGWGEDLRRLGAALVEASVDLHKTVVSTFVASAVRFHYVFSLREVAGVVAGLLRTTPAALGGTGPSAALKAARLWAHECERVYADRLVNDADLATFFTARATAARRHLAPLGIAPAALDSRPLVFSTFCTPSAAAFDGPEAAAAAAADAPDDPALAAYDEAPSAETLRRVLKTRLAEHNEACPRASMDLVLFPAAAEHVTRVARVLSVPGGHVAMVGVGGSGKQSLARLAAHVAGCEVFQVTLTAGYSLTEFKADLATLCAHCAGKSARIAFVMTDAHIVDDAFLAPLNELMATGQVAGLLGPEEREALGAAVRAEVKALGVLDTPEACWTHALRKIRRNLHVVLCLSPAGERLRGMARRFPALVGCVTFDWLRPWPRDALESVAERFLAADTALLGSTGDADAAVALRRALAQAMASTHEAAEAACKLYLDQYMRYNYTTPKSFLELIAAYRSTLAAARERLAASRERLERGVDKISAAAAAVEGLRTALVAEKKVVEEKKAAAAALIESIGREKAAADEAVASSKGDEDAAAVLATQVSAVQSECAADLAAAEPVIAAAEAALNSLDKASLGELKSFSNPAPEVVAVVAACMVLTAPGGNIPKDLSWAAAKKWMGAQSLDAFLKSLLAFDKDGVPPACVDRVERDYLSQPNFKADAVRVKSFAAAGLCAWVTNIVKYFRIYQVVAPKRAALAEANRKLGDANRRLAGIRARVAELRGRVAALEASLAAATAEKVAAEAQAQRTAAKAALADRVIGGLGSEFRRWSDAIEEMGRREATLPGDALLAAAFVTYAGSFNAQLRTHLVESCWVPEIRRLDIPLAPEPSPLALLMGPASAAAWAREGLPRDRLSCDNAAIVGASRRWPLMVDPQLHGAAWIRGREGARGLVIAQQGGAKLMDTVVRCVENGTPLLLENLPEALDPALEPLIARRTVRRGRAEVVALGGREVTLHPDFKLYLHTKLPNPHYGPEVAAQTTIVNFAVTPEGLEEQLLAAVVGHEAAALQAQAAALAAQLAEYTVTLQDLEDGLLARLAASQGDILEDAPLIASLEATKATAAEVADKVAKARAAEVQLSAACEVYRPVAARGALLYFFVDSLSALDRVYWFSMANFSRVMARGMDAAPAAAATPDGGSTGANAASASEIGDVAARVEALVNTVTETVFTYVAQGLFERHKPAAAGALALAVLRARGALPPASLDFCLRAPQAHSKENPVAEWLPTPAWSAAAALSTVDGFQGLADDLVGSAKRWREWTSADRPEEEPLPGDWKRLAPLQRLLVTRALRPDRLGPALSAFVTSVLGPGFASSRGFDLEAALRDAGPATPVLIFVSPGVDAAAAVEALARKRGLVASGRYASVSLGQGQEAPAAAALRNAAFNGGWVLLQNIHLTMEWTWVELSRAIDALPGGTPHPDFQLFLSAEPPPSLERPLPPALLQACVKLTNEPPQGLRANLARAWAAFDDDTLEACARQGEFKAVAFALCFLHAALQERKKFGVGNAPGARSGLGWNMGYPFSAGDLRCCAQLAANYLDAGAKVPWEDLRYLVGDIIYGGHVVEGWDRRLVASYLEGLLSPALLETGKVTAGLNIPPSGMNHAQIAKYIEEKAPREGAAPLGLHPNAETGVALRAAGELCAALSSLLGGAGNGGSGGSGSGASGGAPTVEERCKAAMEAVLEGLPAAIDVEEVRVAAAAGGGEGGGAGAPGPYAMVVIQECERLNSVLEVIRSSLAELALGLKGDLVMSEGMEALAAALASDRVPAPWAAAAFPSLRPLSSWVKNLAARHAQLAEWGAAPGTLPPAIWLPGLFYPASFLTAVQQVAARKAGWALDATALVTEVTRKAPGAVDAPPREGAYIYGLTLEGARWDERAGTLEESRPKEMVCGMPVLHVRGVPAERAAPPPDAYPCPVYATEARFRQEVFTVHLRGGKAPPARWATAGVALLLDVA